MSVLSTSKKAAAAGSWAGGGYSTSATAADASPASAAWSFRLDRPRPRPGLALPPESPDLPPESPDLPSESPDLPPESPDLPPGPPDFSSRDGSGEVSRPSSCLMCTEPTGAGHGRARAGMTAGQVLAATIASHSHHCAASCTIGSNDYLPASCSHWHGRRGCGHDRAGEPVCPHAPP